MVARWSDPLPLRAYRQGFSLGIGETRIVSSTDTGGENSRPRSSRSIDPIRLTMPFTEPQRLFFWRFWNVDLGGGNLEFWFPGQPYSSLLTTEDMTVLTTEIGQQIEVEDWWLVVFAKKEPPPSFTLGGRDWVGALAMSRLL